MKIIGIVRHGLAEDRKEFSKTNQSDELRPLTKKGIRKLKELRTNRLKLLEDFDLVYSSPLTRAKQTTDILWPKKSKNKLEELVLLKPSQNLGELLKFIAQLDTTKSKNIAFVGHEPKLSTLANALLFGNLRTKLPLKFFKGGFLMLGFKEDRLVPGQGILLGYITPITEMD